MTLEGSLSCPHPDLPTQAVWGDGGADQGRSLAPAPKTFSVPQFHCPRLEGSISSLASQMKDAF